MLKNCKTDEVAPFISEPNATKIAIAAALMNKENAIKAAKAGAVGYIAGTAVGIVTDKTGLKRPVNKVLKTIRGVF